MGVDRAVAAGQAAAPAPSRPAGTGQPWLSAGHPVFVLHTGIQWEWLPQELGFGFGMTCWRRLRYWHDAGVWDRLRQVLLTELHRAGKLDWFRAVIDGSHHQTRRGGPKPGRARSAVPGPASRNGRHGPTAPAIGEPEKDRPPDTAASPGRDTVTCTPRNGPRQRRGPFPQSDIEVVQAARPMSVTYTYWPGSCPPARGRLRQRQVGRRHLRQRQPPHPRPPQRQGSPQCRRPRRLGDRERHRPGGVTRTGTPPRTPLLPGPSGAGSSRQRRAPTGIRPASTTAAVLSCGTTEPDHRTTERRETPWAS